MMDVRSGSVLALPAREQAEQRWQAAVAVLAQSMGGRRPLLIELGPGARMPCW